MSAGSDSEDDGYSGMELPTLIKQLRSVLDQYPDDGQILKELIQNAEDAEASEVKILYDGRQIHPEIDPKVLKKRKYLSSLQAPALCVYNDSQFTEKDWKGIKMLHNSIKEEEPLKVGRFGLGFKSVFHLTDFPCIISGDFVLFLNPQDRYSDKVCYMKKFSDLDSSTRQCLGEVLNGTFDFSSEHSSYSGTLIWFPLRTKISELSDNLYTGRKVMDLFHAFKVESPIMLLFLKFIERIHLFQRESDTTQLLFTLELSQSCLQTMKTKKDMFIKKVKELNGKIPRSSIQNSLILDVEITDVCKDTADNQVWLVVNLYKGGDISNTLRDLNSDPSLSYCPYVGLAVPLGKQCQGHVFCFLPLPLENRSTTGLSVHVNGFFALSQNRRYVKWPTADQRQNQAHIDKAIEWNNCLVNEVLPEVYCSVLKEVVQYCKAHDNPCIIQQQIYSLIPDLKEVDINWTPLMQAVIQHIWDIPFLFTPAKGGMWIKLQDSILIDKENIASGMMLDVYSLYDENIVQLPSVLLSTLRDTHSSFVREVSRKSMSDILRSNNLYMHLTWEKKLAVLTYLQDFQFLNGLQLLPVADGSFTKFGMGIPVYFCENPDDIHIFPGLEKRFVATNIPSDLKDILQGMAKKGVKSLTLMTKDVFPNLLQECLAQHFPEVEPYLPSSVLTWSWLQKVWNYISRFSFDNLKSTFSGITIIPDIDSFGRGPLYSMDHIFIARSSPNMEGLPEHVCCALQRLGIICLDNIPQFVLNTQKVQGEVIQYSASTGVMRTLDLLTVANMATSITNFNHNATTEERCALVDYMDTIQNLSPGSNVILKKLELFLDTNNTYCAIESLHIIAPKEDLPQDIPYPERYISFGKSSGLAHLLGASQIPFDAVCSKSLKMMRSGTSIYTQKQILTFMEFLMKNHQVYFHRIEMKMCASEIPFLTSGHDKMALTASHLFDDESSRLKTLFIGEDRFPASNHVREDYLRRGLKLIGLKLENDVSASDILTSAQKIEEMVLAGKTADAKQKMTALIGFLNTHKYHSASLYNLPNYQCIPSLQERPRMYPQTLPFEGTLNPTTFFSSSQLFSFQYSPIIGSVSPIAMELSDVAESMLDLQKQPPADLVIKHLSNISKCYQSKEHHMYAGLLHDVYSFLSAASDFSRELENMQNTKSIWVDDGFQYPKSVYINITGNDLDLRPYRFQLPSSLQQWKSMLLSCGCHVQQTPDMLATVLQEIKAKHDDVKSSNKQSLDVQNDMKLILQILGVLKNISKRPENLYLPTHQNHEDFLVLLPLDKCTYCNADWLRDQTSNSGEELEDLIEFVHPDISENTARQLGVVSLTDRVMDDTDDFDMDYHQSEPLTNRLKYLLREYTDGFSVPKELIQNADDAGATEVCFMYDERENLNARKFLMHEGMSALQGPAFWAYNNASFTESDFQNITKLSGATKEEDSTKVGRFGLGFNSVYNLTDVPSFISGNTLVIFDPHGKYLGRKGLKANLKSVKNQLMLKKMYGQFQPFEGVFECHFKTTGKAEKICRGTLFRFPLRTQLQAVESEIKALSYSRSEMEKFFEIFVAGCGNLVLFTQNITSVKFFHLAAQGNPSSPQLLVHVQKDVLKRDIIPPTVVDWKGYNILSYIDQEWKRHAQNETSIILREKIVIKRNIYSEDMTRLQNIETGSATVPWNITWVTGSKESAVFALSEKLRGLLPLAAVAVAFKHQCESVLYVDKCPQGFYREGHLFCFLPLPMSIPFPVHINATFALTPDRRQLCSLTEDDKMVVESEWNEALKIDAVSRAYVSALSGLEIDVPSDIDTYYNLWPVSGQDAVVKGFYRLITKDEDNVFVVQCGKRVKRSSFHSLKYLDPQLMDIGDIAFKVAEHFWPFDNVTLVKIPQVILDTFKTTGFETVLLSRCISKIEFFEKVFFPNITDTFLSSEDRDKLTMSALMTADQGIHALIKDSSCIPTRPSGTLKQPSQLVHPTGQCAAMFEEDDECFPSGDSMNGFSVPQVLDILVHLGIVKDHLPGELLLERARSVCLLHRNSPHLANRRCKEILRYISHVEYLSKNLSRKQRFSLYQDTIKSQLKEISFFPILQRPVDWPSLVPWKADVFEGPKLAKAKELFSDSVANLVGCSESIMDTTDFCHISHIDGVLFELGLKQKPELDIHTVTRQLCLVANVFHTTSESQILTRCRIMCLELYDYLNSLCQEGNDENVSNNRDLILQTLGNERVILTGLKMVCPQQVALDLSHDLSPHLYGTDRNHERFKSLFMTLGVKEKFELVDFLDAMRTIAKSSGSEKLSNENHTCIVRLASCLSELLLGDCTEDISEIRLPDENGFLHEASSLCLNDCDSVEDDVTTMIFIHPDIHQKVAKWFGVKSKREADLRDHITVSPCFSSFGQSEKLTTRLQRILSGYPCDVSIMKELLQNADDADATELMFIKDFRSLPAEKVFSENWASVQGPALCVYNNSYFSDDDFAGIQNLGQGSKADDPVKTGQYGVGFNAVYHLTDIPSFMTIGPTTEKTICVLDPHVKYVPWATSNAPGGQIKMLEKLRGNYKDAFSGYLEECVPLHQKGTLFRFPLRTEHMAEESCISKSEITTDKVSKLLDDFKSEMFDSLLFLHSVKKITIAHITEDGQLVKEYWLESKMNDSDITKQKGFLSHLRTQAEHIKDHTTGIGITDIAPLEIQLSLSVEDSESRKQQWLVIHHSGFKQDKELPESVITSWERGDIGLLPRGGVAVPLSPADKNFKGKAFCILPLPIETGLPVHVNGHFALDHEARRNLWHGTTDYRCDWNTHTIVAIIIPAYISAIQSLKIELHCTNQMPMDNLQMQLSKYYSFYPDIVKGTDMFWKSMMKGFYCDLVDRKCAVFSVIKPDKGKFCDFPKDRKESIMGKIIWVSLTVQRGFPGYFNNLQEFFPVKKTNSSAPDLSPVQAHDRLRAEIHVAHRKIRILTEVLRDLNMKVINAPDWIYRNLMEANQEDKIVFVTPDTVTHFLKSHSDEYHDKCLIGSLPKKVTETALKSVDTVELLTDFVAKSGTFALNICGLPLSATSSETIGCFEDANPIIVSRYSDLLEAVPEMVLHNKLTKFYLPHVMDSPSLRPLSLDRFTELLPQLLNERTFRSKTPIPWINQENPSQKWIVRLWQYLEEEIFNAVKKEQIDNKVIRTQLQSIESWCVFPAKTDSTQLFLYPVKETANILNMDSVGQTVVQRALMKLNVPHSDRTMWRFQNLNRDNKLAQMLVASWDRPSTVLFVLSEMTFSEIGRLAGHEAESLLRFFCSNLTEIDSDCEFARDRLRTLPFYISLTETLVPIKNVHVVKDSSTLPRDGLKEWSEQTEITLIQHSIFLDKLYAYINQPPLTPSNVYSDLLIPHFQCIPSQFRPIHLKYIRDKLLMKAEDYSQDQKALIGQMKKLNFIETVEGSLHKACDFYCKYEIVFSVMCPPSAFPPFPYSENEWQNFLILIGLQTDVTVDHFVEFAEETERKGLQGITDEVAYKSKILTDHLWKRPDKVREGILLRIRDIKFLLPYIVKEEHDDGKVLIQIHPQMQKAKFLVCYSESTSPQDCYCTWTSKTMYGQNSDPSRTGFERNLESAYAQLGINKVLSQDVVIKHLQNVCSSVSNMQKKNPLEDESLLEVLKKVMTAVYTYFQKNGVSDTVRDMLKSTCIILLPSERIMVAAKQVVTTLSKHEVIPGYIYSGPLCLGQFFPVFHLLGASEEASAKQFALVLDRLKDSVGDHEMNPNELLVAKMAMESLFKYLNDNKNTSNSGIEKLNTLFLPSQKKIMTLSRELVFSDNKFLKSHVQSLDFNYFIGFRQIEMKVSHPLETISLLPQNHRPSILTCIVKEVLSETSKQTSHQGTLSQQILGVIQTPEFISGVMRLINDARSYDRKDLLSESDCEKIKTKLLNLKIFQVENLLTVLTHGDHVVIESETPKKCYLDDSDNEVCLYLSKNVQDSDFDIINTNLAFAIDRLTGMQLGRHTNWLSSMLKAVPTNISTLLDSWNIAAFEYVGSMFSKLAFPPAGTIIPEKFHFMLDNSFVYFTPGEYAGYEVYDHLIDEDVTEGVFMIYVIIKRVATKGDNPVLRRYVIEGKDGQTEEVSATQLYKFIRDKHNLCTDMEVSDSSLDSDISVPMNMEAVLKDIRKTLKDAWGVLGEKDRNRVKKRLYLKWHPDKNPERKEFCTEICKYIAFYVQRLEKGMDIDDIDDGVSHETSPGKENAPDYSWFYHFDARSRMQRDYQDHYETYQEQRTSGHSFSFFGRSSGHPSESHDVYPHHLEAMRWFRQARADLKAATEVLGLTSAYNWLCFKCQQAAEKSVKALWYNKDARRADGIRSHDICSIASGLRDPVLNGLLSRLQNIVKDFERLRYPDRLSYPRIPADVYTNVDARQACELTEQIINHVGTALE